MLKNYGQQFEIVQKLTKYSQHSRGFFYLRFYIDKEDFSQKKF